MDRYDHAALALNELIESTQSAGFREKVRGDVAFLNVFRGHTALKLDLRGDAFTYYWAAAHCYANQLKNAPESTDSAIELARSQACLARWFATDPRPTVLTRWNAELLRTSARARLKALLDSKTGSSRHWDINRLITMLDELGEWAHR